MSWLDRLFEPRKGHYSRVRDARDNYKISNEIIDYDYIDQVKFNPENKYLTFCIIHYHRQPKITRYVTVNYERTPIYEDYSERTKTVKKFNRAINPIKFVNLELPEMMNKFSDISFQDVLKVISAIGIKPKWLLKIEKIQKLDSRITNWQKKLRVFEDEKTPYPQEPFYYPEKPSNFWARLILSFITLGLSFVGFISKAKAEIYININAEKKHKYDLEKDKIDTKNNKLATLIKEHNIKISAKILLLKEERIEVKKSKIELVETDSEGWSDLRQAVNFPYAKLKNVKGVYIIWNKTKNKHYVGQTKNLQSRIFRQHFNKGEVQNIKFAKDWFKGDDFLLKYIILKTKDELDSVEKEYIGKYNSFESGYNKTQGNI